MSSAQNPRSSRRARIRTFLAMFTSVVLLAGGSALSLADQSESTEVFTTELKPGSSERFANNREEIFKAFYARGLDLTRGYKVTNVTVQKDNMTFLLKQGTVFLMKPIEGEITGAAFVGDGVAKMTPPNRTERYMLNKQYGREVLDEPFDTAVFRFTDGSDGALIDGAQGGEPDSALAERAAKIYKERNNWLNGTRGFSLEMQYLEDRISGLEGRDFFLADFHSSEHDWVIYLHNPADFLENVLATTKTMGAKSRRYFVIWSDWHGRSDYGPKGHYMRHPDRDGPNLLRVQHNEMTINIPQTDVVEWTGSLRIEPRVNGLRCLQFDLDNNGDFGSRWYEDNFFPIKLLSVMDQEGQPLEFMHKKDQLLIRLSEPTIAG
ncbi:MAG: hypothetical protein V3U83_09020, partial [Acidobacteriota bacterium]